MPSFADIACFKTPKSGLKEVLASHNNNFDPSKAKKYIYECGELAFEKGYSHFAVGDQGSCLSGGRAENEYYEKGGSDLTNCKNGIGSKSSIEVYTFGELNARPN